MSNLILIYHPDLKSLNVWPHTEEDLINIGFYKWHLENYIYFFTELGPADESTWVDPNFMKTDPRCKAMTHAMFQCPNNSTPSHDLFCRVHILHPPSRICVEGGLTEPNPEYQGRK